MGKKKYILIFVSLSLILILGIIPISRNKKVSSLTNVEIPPKSDITTQPETSVEPEVTMEQSKENPVTTTQEEKTPEVSEEKIKELAFKGDKSVRAISMLVIAPENDVEIDNRHYRKLEKTIKTLEELNAYLNKDFNLDKYFSKNFRSKFINFLFKDINGDYYIVLGNPGLSFEIEKSKLSSIEYDSNKAFATLTGSWEGDNGEVSNVKIELIYENKEWVIEKFDNWGIPDLNP